MALNLIMLGAPGAGKGTQAERVATRRGIPKISTGDILREGIKSQLPVAMIAKAKMDRGELVDDDTMIEIVRERLSRADVRGGFILDGFPRTVDQAGALDRIIAEQGASPLVVVDIHVPEEELVRRLAARRICSACGLNVDPPDAGAAACRRCGGELVHRADDSEQVVRERLRVYARTTKPLVEYYRNRPTFRAVNGAQAPDQVLADLEAAIDAAAAARAGAGAVSARG